VKWKLLWPEFLETRITIVPADNFGHLQRAFVKTHAPRGGPNLWMRQAIIGVSPEALQKMTVIAPSRRSDPPS